VEQNLKLQELQETHAAAGRSQDDASGGMPRTAPPASYVAGSCKQPPARLCVFLLCTMTMASRRKPPRHAPIHIHGLPECLASQTSDQ
jgi:hypothetical protein